MSSVAFDFSELNQVAVDLSDAGARVGAQASTALRKSAIDIEGEAKAFCPVDTGNLRSSIGHDIVGDGGQGPMSAEIGPTANYGHFVEFGTSRMAPHAYMGPAFDRVIPDFVTAVEQLGGDIL